VHVCAVVRACQRSSHSGACLMALLQPSLFTASANHRLLKTRGRERQESLGEHGHSERMLRGTPVRSAMVASSLWALT
jgi:hypothetical protein